MGQFECSPLGGRVTLRGPIYTVLEYFQSFEFKLRVVSCQRCHWKIRADALR